MTTDTTNVNAYLRTKVMTAPPEELRLMLLDGAIRFGKQAAEGLRSRNHELAHAGFTQARSIVVELMTTMRPEVDPELCERVRSLYGFIFRQLVDASLERDESKLEKAMEVLAYERDTWAMLIEKLRAERAAPPQAAPAAPATPSRAVSLSA